MSDTYIKHTWTVAQFGDGDNKFVDDLNHIEDGVAERRAEFDIEKNARIAGDKAIQDNIDAEKLQRQTADADFAERIYQVENRGRYLSIWNSATGKPETDPTPLPYEYKEGDYFNVGTVAAAGSTNYKPDGSSYTGAASTVAETETVQVDDEYRYVDGSWRFQKATLQTATFAGITGQPTDNVALAAALEAKVGTIPSDAERGTYNLTAYKTADGVEYVWERENDYLWLTGSGDVKFVAQAGSPTLSLETSTDQENWTSYTLGSNIALSSSKVYIRNTDDVFSSGEHTVVLTAGSTTPSNIKVGGNIMSLMAYADLTIYSFTNLFNGLTQLVDASELILPPVTKNYCYQAMFQGCTGLTAAPELPATTLKSNCYNSMFQGCTSLKKPPIMATAPLVTACCANMFNGCSSLKVTTTTLLTTKFYKTPSSITSGSVTGMFTGTGGATTTDPVANKQYCYQ